MVYSIFKKSHELQTENKQLNFRQQQQNSYENNKNNKSNEINQAQAQAEGENESNNNNDYISKSCCLLSERDLNCMKNPSFLKLAFKSNRKFYTELITILSSENDKEFTIKCCTQLTLFIDDVLTLSQSDLVQIVNCVLPLLAIEDEYQLLRFGILLGFPQLIIEEATVETKFANLGFNSMTDSYSKIIEVKNSVNIKNSASLMKKAFECYSKDAVFIEIFLALIQAAIGNLALLKYLRAFICEDYIGEE